MRAWPAIVLALLAGSAQAQTTSNTRLAILQAEDRRAPTARDLLILRSAARLRDPQTARIAVRALGRLERPAVIADIVPALRHPLPEVRAEAANAIAQAAQGAKGGLVAGTSAASAQTSLLARLNDEAEPSVRAAISEAVARLPYKTAADVDRAEAAILQASANNGITDRLGVAKGLEALVRLHSGLRAPGSRAIEWLVQSLRLPHEHPEQDPPRDARVRRLALEALIAANAVTDEAVEYGAGDPDPQVRRLAMRAVAISRRGLPLVVEGLEDPAAMVRLEALRAAGAIAAHGGPGDEVACAAALGATTDADLSVALAALDALGGCGDSADVVAALEHTVNDLSTAGAPRGWHRSAHAIVALAKAAPEKAAPALRQFVTSRTPQLRVYAARAAALLNDRGTLEQLSIDEDTRVAKAALAVMGAGLRPEKTARDRAAAPLNAADLRRLAAPRARVTIRDVGRFDIALFTAEAPATVLRFAELAQSGYYNGQTFELVAPNALVQTEDRAARAADVPLLRDEVGLWPHVRGAVGIATRGRDTGDARIFIDLVDNPRFDHEHTVFAQVLNGIDIVDQIQEGDAIESIEIIP